MDKINSNILKELRINSKLTNLTLARKLKVSEGTIRRRIAYLIKNKVIKKFTIEIARGNIFSAVVLIDPAPSSNTSKIAAMIRKVKGVIYTYEVSGKSASIVAEIECSSAEEFNEIIEKVRMLGGLVSTESLIVLKKY